ncbi:MAG: isoprenylcysteine carboxylmethyltransferase family protein [Thermodesulfobacteriota bacterium]
MRGKCGGLLVACQFVFLALLIATTSWRDLNLLALPFFLASLFLAGWAIKVMRLGHFNIRPAIKEGAILVTHGPYRYIRHPMYASILLAGTGLLLITFNWLRLCAFCLLWLVLYLKLRMEEKLLEQHFPDYLSYKKRSRFFSPWF